MMAGLRGRMNSKFVYALMDQGVVSVGNMVVAAGVARYCGAVEFGIFILGLRSLDVINQLSSVLIWGPYIFNLPSVEEDRRGEFGGSVLLHQMTVNLIGVVLLLGFGAWAMALGNLEYGRLFAPLALPSVAIVFREFTRRMYFAHFRFKEALITDAITVALQIGGMLWLLHRGKLGFITALWALSAGCVVVGLYWVVREFRGLRFSGGAYGADLRTNMQLGRWFFGSNMILLASAQVSPWLLSATGGPVSVAAYAVCESVVNIPRVALTSMQNAMGPTMAAAFAEGGKPALRKVVARMNGLITGGSAVFAVGIVALGPWVAGAIYHQRPEHARLILVLLAANLLAYGAALAQSYGLSAINRAQLNFYAAGVGFAVQLVVAFAVIGKMRVPGVALALLVGSVVILAMRLWNWKHEIEAA